MSIGKLFKDSAGSITNLGAFSNWASDTFTGSWVSNTTYTGFSRRVGDTLECRVKLALAGAPNAVSLTINVPQSLTIDTAKVVTTTANQGILGVAWALDAGVKGYRETKVAYNNTTSVVLFYPTVDDDDGIMDATHPFTFGNGDFVFCNFSVPISGWTF